MIFKKLYNNRIVTFCLNDGFKTYFSFYYTFRITTKYHNFNEIIEKITKIMKTESETYKTVYNNKILT